MFLLLAALTLPSTTHVNVQMMSGPITLTMTDVEVIAEPLSQRRTGPKPIVIEGRLLAVSGCEQHRLTSVLYQDVCHWIMIKGRKYGGIHIKSVSYSYQAQTMTIHATYNY